MEKYKIFFEQDEDQPGNTWITWRTDNANGKELLTVFNVALNVKPLVLGDQAWTLMPSTFFQEIKELSIVNEGGPIKRFCDRDATVRALGRSKGFFWSRSSLFVSAMKSLEQFRLEGIKERCWESILEDQASKNIPTDPSEPQSFQEAVRIALKDSDSKAEALAKASAKWPELHQEYLQRAQRGRVAPLFE